MPTKDEDEELSAGLLRSLGVAPLGSSDATRLDEKGYLVVTDVLSDGQVGAIRDAVVRAEAAARIANPMWRPRETLHVGGLVDADPVFDSVWLSPRLLSAVAHLVGPSLWLSSLRLRAPSTGHGLQELHRGQMPSEPPPKHIEVTAIVALVDVPADGGATRLVPGSHRQYVVRDEPETVPLLAGQALVFSELVVHSGTTNAKEQRREALVARYYRRGFGPLHHSDSVRGQTFERLGDTGLLLVP